MKKDENNNRTPGSFEEVISQKLEQVNGKPNQAVWQRLDQSLDQVAPKKHPFAKRNRLLVLALLMLLLGTGALFLGQQQNTQTQPEARISATDATTSAAGNQTASSVNSQEEVVTEPTVAPTPANESKQTNTTQSSSSAPPFTPANTPENTQAEVKALNQEQVKQQPKALAQAQPRGTKNRNHVAETYEATPVISQEAQTSQSIRKAGTEKAATKKKAAATLATTTKPKAAITNEKDKIPTKEKSEAADSAPVVPIPETPIAATEATKDSGLATAADTSKAEPVTDAQYSGAVMDGIAEGSTTADTTTKMTAQPITDSVNSPVTKLNRQVKNPFTVGIAFGPTHFWQNLNLRAESVAISNAYPQPLQAVPNYLDAAAEHNTNTRSDFSYKAGLTVGKQVIKGIRLETGIGYAQFSASTRSNFLAGERPPIAVASPPPPKNLRPLLIAAMETPDPLLERVIVPSQTHRVKTEFNYLMLPLRVRANLNTTHWTYFAAAGVEAGKLLESSITTDHPEVTAGNMAPKSKGYFRNWIWFTTVSGGVGYNLSHRFLLHAGADYSVARRSITTDAGTNKLLGGSPNTLTFTLGLTYSFLSKE